MKKEYFDPKAEIIELLVKDIVTDSEGEDAWNGEGENGEGEDFEFGL